MSSRWQNVFDTLSIHLIEWNILSKADIHWIITIFVAFYCFLHTRRLTIRRQSYKINLSLKRLNLYSLKMSYFNLDHDS